MPIKIKCVNIIVMDQSPKILQQNPEVAERITAAAVKFPNGTILTGKSHQKIEDDQIENDPELKHFILYANLETGFMIKGFMTNKNRFVTRIEAAKIAYNAGQITEDKKTCRED